MKKFLKHNKPKERKHGIATRPCVICWRLGAHVRIYGIHMCRQCFRENAPKLGFKKYD